MSTTGTVLTFTPSVGYSTYMSPNTHPTAREHIAAIAVDNGWSFTPGIAKGPGTVLDLATRGDEAALVTWNHEGLAAVDIKVAPAGGEMAPIKAARAMGLIALREVLEAVSA